MGRYFETDEGKVHAEAEGEQGVRWHTGASTSRGDCWQEFRESRAARCLVCDGPVLGSYYDVGDGGVVHGVEDGNDCMVQWKAGQRRH